MLQKIKTLAAGLVFTGIALPAMAQGNFDDVEIRTEHLRGGIYALFGAGGNIGVSAGEDGVFLIDDQFAPLTGKIRAAVAEISDQPIRFLINTHYHGDHTGGNENFGSAGTLIMAHDNVRVRLLNPSNGEPAAPAALPVVTYSDQASLHINGDDARAVHISRAHTDGDTIIHFQDANVIHMGDIFFRDWYPFVDVNGGGNVDGVITAVNWALEQSNDETIIIPGHGPIATPNDLRRYRDMLVDTRGRIAALVEEGMSEDDVVAANPTADYDEEGWSWQFINGERYTRSVYQSLK